MPTNIQHFRRASPPTSIACTVLALVLVAAAGCDLPDDPKSTLQRVRGGTMRVGITHAPPFVALDGAEPRGIEIELIAALAKSLDAEIEWVHHSETTLIESLHRHELDLVAAGLRHDTVWKSRAGLTRPFIERRGGKHVLATPPGENAWLLHIDRFIESAGHGIAAEAAKAAEAEAAEAEAEAAAEPQP